VGVDPAGAVGTVGTSAWAVANDADVVNALGIGIMPNFASGPDSFNVMAADFAAFESALIAKLRRETGQVPVPGALLSCCLSSVIASSSIKASEGASRAMAVGGKML